MPNDPLAIISTIALLTLVIAYVIGIFVYDAKRRKRGKVSIFMETCSCHHEGGAKRILKAYRKQYGCQGHCQTSTNGKKEA